MADLDRDLASPELKVIAEPVALTAHTLAPMNKCLAQNNKSPDRRGGEPPQGALLRDAPAVKREAEEDWESS